MRQIIIASNNQGKIKEFKEILVGYQVLSLADIADNTKIIEDGNSFDENALIKARTIYQIYHLPVISDDSGLCIIALNLEPGIYSARYYGLNSASERRKKVLELMEGINDRQAYFHCSLVYIDENGIEHLFHGDVYGNIGFKEQGSNGFGYDPIFYIDNGVSFADLTDEEKNKISHRGIALRKFEEFIQNDFNNK